jgi:hypothetical protein
MRKKNYFGKFKLTSFIIVLLMLGGALSVNAQDVGDEEEIEFSIDDIPIGPGNGKAPVLMPTLWQNGYLLDFHGTHADYVLRILDATDNVVYMAVVPSLQTQVWLPTTLSGTYRIELISGNLLFYGYITL